MPQVTRESILAALHKNAADALHKLDVVNEAGLLDDSDGLVSESAVRARTHVNQLFTLAIKRVRATS